MNSFTLLYIIEQECVLSSYTLKHQAGCFRFKQSGERLRKAQFSSELRAETEKDAFTNVPAAVWTYSDSMIHLTYIHTTPDEQSKLHLHFSPASHLKY